MYKFNKDEKAININKNPIERRTFERFYLPVAVIRYSVLGKEWFKGETMIKNISLGGIQFCVKEALEVGSRVTLQIHRPSHPFSTQATGEVVWIKENHRFGGGFVVGLKFTQADFFDLQKLLKDALPLFHQI